MGFLQLNGLTKRYGSAAVVNDISLSIGKGQLVCLLGPSGCGKTTTLRLIAGFLEPDAGEIHVGGRRISAPEATEAPERRNMSMIFQSYALWPHMTVFDNIAYGLRLRNSQGELQHDRPILAATADGPRATAIPASCRAGSSSGSRWRARW